MSDPFSSPTAQPGSTFDPFGSPLTPLPPSLPDPSHGRSQQRLASTSPSTLDDAATDPPPSPPSPSETRRIKALSAKSRSTYTSSSLGDETEAFGVHTYTPPSDVEEEDKERIIFEDPTQPDSDELKAPDFTGQQQEPKTRKVLKVIKESPKTRVLITKSIKTQAKNLVRAIDPNSGYCILTGKLGPIVAIQFAHVTPRATKAGNLTVLEWKWGMNFFSLYIDTRFNLILLKSDWHIAMDSYQWALVPHYKIVRELHEWVLAQKVKGGRPRPISEFLKEANKQPSASQPQASTSSQASLSTYTYFMLPLTTALDSPLHRIVDNKKVECAPPYEDLGPLKSHVQPHFVVYALGAKLAAKREELKDGYSSWLEQLSKDASFGQSGRRAADQVKTTLNRVRDIYAEWGPDGEVPDEGDVWYKKIGGD
ncbi:hypothetical protein FB45DRAFT_940882 [Roridomyces roridus]|uniref:HNH nuclease domain-containing protein n=1 Tax=Roridomyces roridus TaxID=1738132 RepID=A0AAD7B6T1_9AGAR|nr:hypothetical protein FB45DRAFT_940882 [Roridomyces roridus]